ncbi:MAG: hypothetical protein CVV47_00010 [Spirochaetae bacterium HGW-Spirochaetae-3]|nr:MAG: hypothetical protein CVV47_00010 [Spirochaetae bacterium HGW-Spirochaetae-3]
MDMPVSARREPLKRLRSRAIAAVGCGAIAALVVTCDMPPSFGDEYRDSSTNFIAAHSLTEPPLATDLVTPLDSLALWDWAWRGQTVDIFEYMTLDMTTYAGTGPGGTDAGLLETVNLAVNPSFSGGLTTGWSASALASISGAGTIHGSALQGTTPSATDYVYIGDTLFSDASATAHSYTLSFNATGTTGLRYIESGYFDLQTPSWSATGPSSILVSNISTGTSQVIGLTNSGVGNFVFDDVSAIRADVPATKWSMVLRLSPVDTQPSLAPGIYEFSLYVKRPPTHFFSTDATRGDDEDYASRFVTLRMTQTTGSDVQTIAMKSYDLTALADPDVWTELTLRMPSGSNFTFDEDTETQVIELSISPMNPSAPEAGAVLIANPSLMFYIDGY